MEYVNCILCNTDDTHLLVKKNSFNVVKCNGCGLVYLNPRLDSGELAELYNISESSTVEKNSASQKDVRHDAHKIKKFKISIRLLKKHKKDIQNIFDLGCSTGIFLGMVAEEGWTPFGSDVNRNLVEENKKRYGNQVKLQLGEEIDFPDQFFDVVTLFDSIEHMPNPITTLVEVFRVLKNNGVIIISTPKVNGLFPALTYTFLGKTIGAWDHPTPPGHVFQFSENTLMKTLEKAGFAMIAAKDFAMYLPYTVGELENSIINVLRKGKQNTKYEFVQNQNNSHVSIKSFPQVKKIPRLLIRVFCWGLVATIYPIARLLRSGDSMVVIASKAEIKAKVEAKE